MDIFLGNYKLPKLIPEEIKSLKLPIVIKYKFEELDLDIFTNEFNQTLKQTVSVQCYLKPCYSE